MVRTGARRPGGEPGLIIDFEEVEAWDGEGHVGEQKGIGAFFPQEDRCAVT